eukprot:CAMPEP_0175952014 /NCGR_PEP_ID=MMETSP0108-20121206/30511_1 /TAXON_ID=195067 ORGANISM="Goniomonas pacifica, Strain CCMP1869" /NCGR_SAMPLE_ID=MMETSP0108 /ASSEMBLY_ACC=CAM_ASM_000204 /LENGTH=239 /DNA_ID=CAMNT_0017278319 /DNA_START=134 /DNA_END=853 /DNA_ORIENTATION=-
MIRLSLAGTKPLILSECEQRWNPKALTDVTLDFAPGDACDVPLKTLSLVVSVVSLDGGERIRAKMSFDLTFATTRQAVPRRRPEVIPPRPSPQAPAVPQSSLDKRSKPRPGPGSAARIDDDDDWELIDAPTLKSNPSMAWTLKEQDKGGEAMKQRLQAGFGEGVERAKDGAAEVIEATGGILDAAAAKAKQGLERLADIPKVAAFAMGGEEHHRARTPPPAPRPRQGRAGRYQHDDDED